MNDQPPLVTGTDFVFVPVTNVEQAKEFYCGVLGLRCSASYGGDIGVEFETGNLTIQVIDMAKIGRDFETTKAPSRCTSTM